MDRAISAGSLHLQLQCRLGIRAASAQTAAFYRLNSETALNSSLTQRLKKPRICAAPSVIPLPVLGSKGRRQGRAEGQGFGARAQAFEAAETGKGDGKLVAHNVKIGVYFIVWWALGVAFNIYNKKVLNVFPYPLLTSTLSLVAGSLMMLLSWASGIADAPPMDAEFWTGLAPVAVAHAVGQVGTTVSMSKNDVSFTHVIKSAEPAFSVVFSKLFMRENFPLALYMSLVPIIGGCALAAATEINFNMIGFVGAMISNVAFVMRNSVAKRSMKGRGVSGMNYYACLTISSLLVLTPFAFLVEGPQMWAHGWQTAVDRVPAPQLLWWVVAQSVFYHLYNQVSYMSLDEISPLTFSIGNTMKRVAIIGASLIIFRTPVRPLNALGAAIAISGTFLYSQVKT